MTKKKKRDWLEIVSLVCFLVILVGSLGGWVFWAYSLPEVRWYHFVIGFTGGVVTGYILYLYLALPKMIKGKEVNKED